MTGLVPVLITTFLASAVEAIEMVTIVVGVGATRGWRSTLLGAAAGFVVLMVVVAVFGLALSAIPIGPLRLVIGALLLVFGLQWLRKGVVRVAARGFAGMQVDGTPSPEVWTASGVDWTAFVLSFKGVLLEGLEVAFIVVSVGATAGQLGVAVLGGAAGSPGGWCGRRGPIATCGTDSAQLPATRRRPPSHDFRFVLGDRGTWGELARR